MLLIILLNIISCLSVIIMFLTRVYACETTSCKRRSQATGVVCCLLAIVLFGLVLYGLLAPIQNVLKEGPP
jgi:hypothetical protein